MRNLKKGEMNRKRCDPSSFRFLVLIILFLLFFLYVLHLCQDLWCADGGCLNVSWLSRIPRLRINWLHLNKRGLWRLLLILLWLYMSRHHAIGCAGYYFVRIGVAVEVYSHGSDDGDQNHSTHHSTDDGSKRYRGTTARTATAASRATVG